MQECNAEERKDRIWVYPCVSLCCGEHQHERDATQRRAYYVVLWTGFKGQGTSTH